MLRIIQNTSAAGAKTYYTSASMADYYTQGQELAGIWRGKGAGRLGLSGRVGKEAWDALCDNRHPVTGKALTPRRKQDRRVGYDLNFHVPKSVSLLYGLTNDERILNAFRESVDETMREIEAETKTRVRKGGKNEDRVSGNLLWGEFIHQTARPINGVPDPHLHAHCFAFNVTFDEKENRWKAVQFGDVKRDASFFEAMFHSRMSERLAELGLPIERTRNGWEIVGLARSTLEKFSRRTAHIEEKARTSGITSAAGKSELGAKTRERKQKNLTMAQLRHDWMSRLSGDESDSIAKMHNRLGSAPTKECGDIARQAAKLAVEHCFERKSVVPERHVFTEALKRSYGHASAQNVMQAISEHKLIVGERDGCRLVTIREVLDEEQRMTDFARRGRGTCPRLSSGSHEFREQKLNDGQRRAVLHILNCPDRVIIVRGAAGVGKTTMMREAVNAIEAGGKHVFTFAPSADASRGVLRDQEGFKNADTVARLLVDEQMQGRIRGQVIWIDEAGMLGMRAMAQVFDLAAKLDSRIILSGDRRQHGSVERGGALQLLETEAGLVPAEIVNIQRQKGAYKQAIEALSEGRVRDGLRQLDELGWIREIANDERYKSLASDYVAAIASEKSALVVSPTHREGDLITHEIRRQLQNVGYVGREEHQIAMLTNTNLTLAQRLDPVNYNAGDVLVFTQNAKGFRKGERVIVGQSPLPLDQANRFQVFHARSIGIAKGDVLRITCNSKTIDGEHRVNNGAIYKIRGFTDTGDIRLNNGWTISRDFGHVSYGYVVTSHAAQSKTVDEVFIGQSSLSEPAASREQLYVSASRGRNRATVYTDDKKALSDAVQKTDDHLTATELMPHRNRAQIISLQESDRHLLSVAEMPPHGKEIPHDR